MAKPSDTSELSAVLRHQRERLHLKAEALALATGIDAQRIADLESGSAPLVRELRQLSRFLFIDLVGYDPDEGVAPRPLASVQTLLRAADNVLPVRAWPDVVEAAEVACALVELEALRDLPSRWDELRATWTPDGRHSEPFWRDGKRLAEQVRDAMEIGEAPITSMQSLCERLGIAVLETRLPEHVSALCFADADHGPAVVLNRDGRNEDPLVRRFSLAHELCHVLFDRHELDGIQHFDTYQSWRDRSEKPAVEVRADAFSAHLLAPETAFARQWEALDAGLDERARTLGVAEHFGLSFVAAWFHARTARCLPRDLPPAPEPRRNPGRARFGASERRVTDDSLFAPLAPVRRGPLLVQTLAALREERLHRSRALELLDVDGDTFDAHREAWEAALAAPPSVTT